MDGSILTGRRSDRRRKQHVPRICGQLLSCSKARNGVDSEVQALLTSGARYCVCCSSSPEYPPMLEQSQDNTEAWHGGWPRTEKDARRPWFLAASWWPTLAARRDLCHILRSIAFAFAPTKVAAPVRRRATQTCAWRFLGGFCFCRLALAPTSPGRTKSNIPEQLIN